MNRQASCPVKFTDSKYCCIENRKLSRRSCLPLKRMGFSIFTWSGCKLGPERYPGDVPALVPLAPLPVAPIPTPDSPMAWGGPGYYNGPRGCTRCYYYYYKNYYKNYYWRGDNSPYYYYNCTGVVGYNYGPTPKLGSTPDPGCDDVSTDGEGIYYYINNAFYYRNSAIYYYYYYNNSYYYYKTKATNWLAIISESIPLSRRN